MKGIVKNILWIGILCGLNSCSSHTYEWTKVRLVNNLESGLNAGYSNKVNKVDVVVKLQEKTGKTIYVENPETYFQEEKSTTSSKNTAVKAVGRRKSLPKVEIGNEALNKSLLIKYKEPQSPQEESYYLPKASDSLLDASEENLLDAKVPDDKTIEDKALIENLSPLKTEELNETNLLKDSTENILVDQYQTENTQQNSFLWVGFVILIVGLIIGLIFGGYIYLVSVIGILFLLIGYFVKV